MGLYLAAFLCLTAQSSRVAGQAVWLFKLGERQGLPAWLFRLSFAGGLLYLITLSMGFEPVHEVVALPMPVRIGGLVLAVVGAVFAIHAQHYMGASWRIGSAEGHSGAIVDTGPFRLSRNPVFVGQVMLFAGFVFARPDLLQFALLAAIVLAVWLQVRIEEKVLEQDLGAPYRAYRARVPRWLSLASL
jgi:protein-S-isoprenylcysteine O-methyltransferase Ste14